MKTLTPIQEKYVEAARVFHWATREHYVIWFTGKPGRHKQTEHVLPALIKKSVLMSARYGRKKIYTYYEGIPFYLPQLVHHGLACTEGLVRFVASDNSGVVYSENFFRANRLGSIPEWGIKYPNGNLLLYEHSTYTNFQVSGNVAGKITRYNHNFHRFKEAVGGEPFVVFVLDVHPREIPLFIKKNKPGEQFFFTNYETFKSVPLGQQLTAPIYFWADGKEYSLRHESRNA